MTGHSTLLTEFKKRAGPSITFEDDIKGYTVGYGLISKDNVIIEEVSLVDGLKHNLLSISQLSDKGNSVKYLIMKPVFDDESDQEKMFKENAGKSATNEAHNSTSIERPRGVSSNQNCVTHQDNNEASSSRANLPQQKKWTKDHPFELIIGDASSRVQRRKETQDECLYSSFISQDEPKKGKRYEFVELVYGSVVTTDEKAYIEVTFKARRSGETEITLSFKEIIHISSKRLTGSYDIETVRVL
ncbi:hypothetical protein AgCh_005231 [Apium graveolens]